MQRSRSLAQTSRGFDATRQREKQYLDAGIRSVPAIILDRQYLISGGQPPDVFEQALRQIIAGA